MAVTEPSAGAVSDAPLGKGEDRILTVPNVITLFRLLGLPVFVYALFGRDNRAAAAALLLIVGSSDWVDGYIARHYNQITNLGKILDPVADRLLFFVAITSVIIDGSVPLWFAVMVLVREVVVAGTTVVLGLLGARRVDVTWWGKAGTFALMVTFPLFLASESTIGWAELARSLAWLIGGPGLVFSYIAWAMYVPLGLMALRDGRADRAGR